MCIYTHINVRASAHARMCTHTHTCAVCTSVLHQQNSYLCVKHDLQANAVVNFFIGLSVCLFCNTGAKPTELAKHFTASVRPGSTTTPVSYATRVKFLLAIYIYIYIYMCVCVCVCACVRSHVSEP